MSSDKPSRGGDTRSGRYVTVKVGEKNGSKITNFFSSVNHSKMYYNEKVYQDYENISNQYEAEYGSYSINLSGKTASKFKSTPVYALLPESGRAELAPTTF